MDASDIVTAVVGVLVDPTQFRIETTTGTETVHETVEKLWRTLGEEVDQDFTPENTQASLSHVLLGEITLFY